MITAKAAPSASRLDRAASPVAIGNRADRVPLPCLAPTGRESRKERD